nr:DEAD-box ATP-dependent RNA helicase 58, chloroplastic-like [Setaria viridis]
MAHPSGDRRMIAQPSGNERMRSHDELLEVLEDIGSGRLGPPDDDLIVVDPINKCEYGYALLSERSKKPGSPTSTAVVVEFLRNSDKGSLDVLLLEEEMNFNARAASFPDVKGIGFMLVSTDTASRGFDLPKTSHIYNSELPTTLITEDEHFVLQRFQNELKFHCEEPPLESMFTLNSS